MEQPQKFIDTNFSDFVFKLHKFIYGFKQAPWAWFTRLSHDLLDIGFVGSQVDHSLFTFHTAKVHIFHLVYDDNIVIRSNDDNTVSWPMEKLKGDFAMKDIGPLGFYTGIQATCDSTGLYLRQSKSIIDLLERVNMRAAKPYCAPTSWVPSFQKWMVIC